jgi:chromate transporter
LGLIGFGGPLAIIAQIQKELVIEKKWMSVEDFNKALPLIKSMPGPVAWQTIIYVLQARVGSIRALFAGLFFLLPSFLMMVALLTGEVELPTEPGYALRVVPRTRTVQLVDVFNR